MSEQDVGLSSLFRRLGQGLEGAAARLPTALLIVGLVVLASAAALVITWLIRRRRRGPPPRD